MESAGHLFMEFSIPFESTPSKKSVRGELLGQLYELYTCQPEETIKENRKRYHAWVRIKYPLDCVKSTFSKIQYNSHKTEFKKEKLPYEECYIPTLSLKYFCIKMAHIKGDEGNDTFRYMVSIAKDIRNRKGNVAKYILGSIKVVKLEGTEL